MNAKSSRRTTVIMTGLVSALVFATHIMGSRGLDAGHNIAFLQTASAAQEGTTKASIKQPPAYFPNTEELRPDEMRVTALGTGMPTTAHPGAEVDGLDGRIGQRRRVHLRHRYRLNGESVRVAPRLFEDR